MVNLDDQIVENVGAAQAVAWFTGRPPERPVIAPIQRILAPSEIRRDPPRRQGGAGPQQAVGPPPQPDRTKPSGRGPAVALALVRLDTAAAERNPYGARPGNDEALGALPGTRADPDHPQ